MIERNGIIAAIGNTPLIRLPRLSMHTGLEVYAKLEAANPGGSIKDRAALGIIEQAFRQGKIREGSVVVESSSGNMGVGLAMVCRFYRLPFICVVDPKTTVRNLEIIESYGARIDMVNEPDAATGEFLPARIKRVQEILDRTPGGFWPNQYLNKANSLAHFYGTFREIFEAMGDKLDLVFCATSTCGTIDGCVRYVRSRNLETRVVAVDCEGSMIFSDRKSKRLIPGFGASTKPKLCPYEHIHETILVSDIDCINGCRWLLENESILAGGSSGGLAYALASLALVAKPGERCVLVLPDRGERYLDTIYSNAWVREHFGYDVKTGLLPEVRRNRITTADAA